MSGRGSHRSGGSGSCGHGGRVGIPEAARGRRRPHPGAAGCAYLRDGGHLRDGGQLPRHQQPEQPLRQHLLAPGRRRQQLLALGDAVAAETDPLLRVEHRRLRHEALDPAHPPVHLQRRKHARRNNTRL